MGTLSQILNDFDRSLINTDEKKTKITNIIEEILDREKKEKQEIQTKIDHETCQVQKVQQRLQNLQSNNEGSGNTSLDLTDDNNNKKLWKEYELRRSSAMDDFTVKGDETSMVISEEQSNYLRDIANYAHKFCGEEYKEQQKKLGESLKYSHGEKDSTDLERRARSFQTELGSDVIPHLFETFYNQFSKDKTMNTNMQIQNGGSRIKNYMKACVVVCWHVQANHNGAELVWKVPVGPKKNQKEEFICVTTGCKKTKSCKLRVYVPCVLWDGRVLNPGKYSCLSCDPSCDTQGQKHAKEKDGQNQSQTTNEADVIVHVPGAADENQISRK